MWYVSAPFLAVVAMVRMPSYVLSCGNPTPCIGFPDYAPEGEGERMALTAAVKNLKL